MRELAVPELEPLAPLELLAPPELEPLAPLELPLAPELEPTYTNHASALRLADIDGDKRLDIVLSTYYLTGDETRAGGFSVFRNLR